jgi:hypothetical protein
MDMYMELYTYLRKGYDTSFFAQVEFASVQKVEDTVEVSWLSVELELVNLRIVSVCQF